MATLAREAFFKVSVKGFKSDLKRIMPLKTSETIGEALHSLLEEACGDDCQVSFIEAGEDLFQCDLDTPVQVLKELGYNSFTVWLKKKVTSDADIDTNNNKILNAFTVFSNTARQYSSCTREEKTQKDALFNKVVDTFKTNAVGFTPIQVESTGKTVATSLTSVLWFMDGRHDRFEARAVTLPDMFQSLRGYRSYKGQHQKIPEITEEDLQENVNKLGELLLLPWILNPKFKKFKEATDNLLRGLQKYLDFLKSMKKRNKAHRDSTEPVKNLTESWILKVNEGCVQEKVDKTYEALIERLNGVGLYEPIDLCDIESLDKEVRRKWLNNMKLPFPVTQFTYRYGNYLGNLNMVWKIPQDIRDRKSSVECQLVKDTLNQISLYKTRRMHKDFIARYRMFAKPVILRNMFQFLTEYEYTPESSEQSQIDLRFCECLLESEDTELIFDLRKHNGRPLTEEFDSFWSELHKYLEEKTVVHERRHSDINYMPFAMSVENLREIIQDRLPAGAKIPSVSWLKLNFCPSNPYKNSSANYTGRFKVKFKVQQRLLRAQHEDNEYGRNLFGHLKEFACMFREDTLFQSLDDKAIVPVGEPAHAISTGVRIHHGGLVTGDRQNLAMDHDFHIAGIVPSVCFMINIPTSHNDSFYNGLVHVTVKDKVFEASSPLRHSTETISLLRGQYSSDDVSLEKPILIRYTDGGPDHRVTYRSVQICSLVEFVALDLDMLVCARTAPSMSYLNPAERTMSLLNIGLQNVALQRDKMSPEFEMIAKGKSLKGLRNVAERNDKFKEQYSESTKVPITVIKQRFSKLKWKGENIIIHDATTEEEMETMIKSILMVLDENVTIDMKNLTKLKSIRIDQFLARHARCRHYIFQIKKCGQDDCAYCVLNPPRLSPDVFEKLHFVPDPTCDNNTYKSFGDLYGTETDDTGRPSLAHKPQMTDRDKKFKKLLVGTKVRGFVDCCECGKRRVVYSDKRLNPQEETVLKRVQEELMFVCGSVLFPGGQYQDTIVVKEGQCCNSPIEVTYYAGKTMVFDPICFHCGDIDVADTDAIRQLKEQFGIVRPICNTCLETGKTVVTRNALKVKKKGIELIRHLKSSPYKQRVFQSVTSLYKVLLYSGECYKVKTNQGIELMKSVVI